MLKKTVIKYVIFLIFVSLFLLVTACSKMTVSVTIQTVPVSTGLKVDGVDYISPVTLEMKINDSYVIQIMEKIEDSSSAVSGDDVRYSFYRWNDGVTANPRTIKILDNTTYVAELRSEYKVETGTKPADIATIAGAGWYEADTTQTFTAPTVTGYTFDHWEVNGINAGTVNPIDITIDSPKKVVAVYSLNSYALTITTSPDTGLGIVINGSNYTSPKTLNFSYNTSVTFGVTTPQEMDKEPAVTGADTRYTFDQWNDGNTNPSRTITMTADITYTAKMKKEYKVETGTKPADIATIAGAGWYEAGTVHVFTAPTVTGYTFDHWEVNGVNVSSSSSLNLTIDSPKKVVAVYTLNSYALTITTSPDTGLGIVINGSNYTSPKTLNFSYNTSVTFEVTTPQEVDKEPAVTGADTRYTFDQWNDGNTNPSRTITVTADITYTAEMKKEYKVETGASPAGIATIAGAGWYEAGTVHVFTAPTVTGYTFDHWEVNGVNVSSNSSLNLTIDSPKNAVAVYQTSYYIEADNETHYTGKWAHITVTVRDRFDNPVPNIPVAFNFSSSSSQILNLTDKSKVDVDPIVYTDSNGIASLDGYFSESSVETVKAYLVDYPNIYSNFQVNVLTPNWIFLILMGADNNLESSAIFDLIEMSTTNPGIAIVGIADVSYLESGDGQLSGVTDDFLFMLDEAGTIYDEPLGIEVDSGSPETLEALISGFYGIESNYKALVLWNHGFAWFDENEPRTRGIIYDDTNNTFLRIRDVQNAIISATNGAGFDILGMDACLMSSVEIAYQLKDTASYFVSSAFTEPGSGWDYSFLDDIEAYHSPFEVGKLIVDSYVASLPTTPKLSLAVWDLSYLDELYNSINAFSYELDSILDDGIKSKILNVYYPNLTQYYDGSNLIVDLGDFLGYIYYDDEVTQNVKDLALEAWYDLTAAVPYSTVRGGTNNSKGTSIFFPDSLNVYNSFYDSFYELDFWWNWWEILVRHIIDPDWELGVDLYGPNYYGDIILLSNESVDGDNFEPIGTLNSEGSKSLEIPKGLPLGAYRVDYLFELPEDATVDKIVGPNERNRTPSKIGVARYFWVHDFRTNSDYLLEATLQSSGNYCEIWVEDPGEINTAMADQLAAEFDNIIYSLIVNNFYTPSDVNADGKVAILCFDIQDNFETVGSYTAGYFSPVDLYSQDYYPTSNEMEIFYIDTYPTMHYPSTDPIDVSKAYSTLVHEFQHMVNFNRNVFVEFGASMDTWLNEALSMAAEHIYEGVQTDRISYYNASSSISNGHSLLYWDRYGDVLSNYALSYLFGQYLRIQAGAGNTIFKEILMDYNNDYRCVENAIHNHVDSQLDFGRFMTYFRLALNLRQEFGYFGFKGDPDFATIETKLFETLPESIRGGGAILVSILSNPYVKPYDSGEHIKPVGIDLEAINF